MDKRVLVFGSYVTDLCGRSLAFPKPGETVKGSSFKLGPGGKGSNQAVAASRAGANVTFVTKVGKDALGQMAVDFFKAEKIFSDGIFIDSELDTGAALISVNEVTSQNQIVVVGSACENFVDEDMPLVMSKLEESDILLIQLETNMMPIKAILRQARALGVLTVLNPAPAPTQSLDDELLRCVDIITPNETETEVLTGISVTDAASAQKASKILMDKGVSKVVITLGEKGAFTCTKEREQLFGIAECGSVVDTTGAGDAFSGGMVAALARNFDFFDAIVYGIATAGISITRQGTAPAMPYRNEIDELYAKSTHAR